MKLAFSSALNVRPCIHFLSMLIVAMKSYCKYNQGRPEWYVFHDGLTDEQKNHLIIAYPKVVLCEIDKAKYAEQKKYDCVYWTFEAFLLSDYDIVINFDSDILFTGNIAPLIDGGYQLGAHYENRMPNQINNGVFVVGKEYRTEKIYNQLLTYPREKIPEKYFGRDQAIENYIFEGKFQEIGQEYNCFPNDIQFLKNGVESMKIMHYYIKPWNPRFQWEVQLDLQRKLIAAFEEAGQKFPDRIL